MKKLLTLIALCLPISVMASGGGSSSPAPAPAPAPAPTETTTKTYTSSGSSVSSYKGSWAWHALKHQDNIDQNAPLGRAAFLTTHNSYNAGVYSQNGSYADPNQNLSIRDQLEIGVRAIELDIHYTFSSSGSWYTPWNWSFSEELKLCHGNGDTGCHPNDRYFTQGLTEVRDFLNANPKEVVIIYLEDHMEGKYDKAIGEMNSYIGNKVYKPNGCQTLPMNISKASILAAGKQVLLIGGNCATSNWAGYVFKNHFSATEKVENLKVYPTCTIGSRSTDFIINNLVRVYEDRTTLSDWFGNPGAPIAAADAANLAKCGIGAIGLDKLNAWDSRHSAQIWSWGQNEPNNSNGEDCATQRSDSRFNDVKCSNSYRVACQNATTRAWKVTSGSYSFNSAASGCSSEWSGYSFSVPVNGYENAQLQDVKSSAGVSTVWINYSDQATEGEWVPGN